MREGGDVENSGEVNKREKERERERNGRGKEK